MILNLENVEIEDEDRTYIREEGILTLKVIKVTGGETPNGNPKLKVHFQDKQGRFAIDSFVITKNSLWKIKILTKALKLPNIVDTNMMLERYVVAHFKAKRTQNGEIFEIKKYEPSPLTNTYEAQSPTAYQEPKSIEIDEEKIPF